MKTTRRWTTVAALAALAGTVALAQPAKETASQPAAAQPQLPEGWTAEDMEACVMAGMPGEQHEFLAKNVGTWEGACKMWMGPDSKEPMVSTCTTILTPLMDGRYIKGTTRGEIPGMGEFLGEGYYGYDNVAGRFVSTWIDNHSTGIMHGTGELSSDGKTLTWTFEYYCPITKKPTKMREIERRHSDDSFTLEMWGTDPKAGKEYKMMEIAYKRISTASVPTSTN
jgi:hypothetical protein